MASKLLTVHYTSSGLPKTGLSPVVTIFELNAIDPAVNNAVVIDGAAVEIGSGWYRYDFTSYDRAKNYVFTFDGGASLTAYERYKYGGNESYTEDVAPSVWEQQINAHTVSGSTGLVLSQIKADTTTISLNDATLASMLSTLLKYQRNRTRIDLTAAQLVIYDDDGATPLTTFNLRDFSGMPNVQEVCEKIPVI